ncbi:MAG: MFS transporter [Ignavibacteria bacterium]|nr:MFS transporter [Ignavibacteria bacterium]
MTTSTPLKVANSQIILTVLVCALGYFVDIYDLILFAIVRTDSLRAIGVTPDLMQSSSELILNSQMVGMLLGGLLFGVLADKRGRLSVLLGSILLYSLMNIANAFVSSVPMYAVLRFFSGIGLAGELGIAITLVSEVMPAKSRGYGTTIVASMGILGAVAAYFVHELFNWQAAFVIGGVLGLALLALRVRVSESSMFLNVKQTNEKRGDISMLFKKKRISVYIACAAIGIPIWYVIGLLVTFAPEFARESGSVDNVVAGQCVMWAYVGLAGGDLLSGLLSQFLKSRKLSVLFFILFTTVMSFWYLTSPAKSAATTYLQCGLLGFGAGYWAVFITTAAEQFGTNLRATVATTIPNIVRGGLVPILLAFSALRTSFFAQSETPFHSSAIVIAIVVLLFAGTGLYFLRETYGKPLNYVEH